MFTGIVETTGKIIQVIHQNQNLSFWVQSPISNQLSVNQSLAHNGVCLTIEDIKDNAHKVTLIQETLLKTTLANPQVQALPLNLERCLKLSDRLDGHLMQGHVDTTASIHDIKDNNGSWEFSFCIQNKDFIPFLVEKGSIAINGVSLTIFNVHNQSFSVGIIPHTYHLSNFSFLKKGMLVNIEVDILGKYFLKNFSLYKNAYSS